VLILIVKDGATQVPREVASLEEAQAIANQGFDVLVQGEDGTKLPLAHAIAAAVVPAFIKEVEAHITGGGSLPEPKPEGIVAKVKKAITRKK
jgi:hypothetical protein